MGAIFISCPYESTFVREQKNPLSTWWTVRTFGFAITEGFAVSADAPIGEFADGIMFLSSSYQRTIPKSEGSSAGLPLGSVFIWTCSLDVLIPELYNDATPHSFENGA